MTQPQGEFEQAAEEYEAWRDLQALLEERDREWWADGEDDEPQYVASPGSSNRCSSIGHG